MKVILIADVKKVGRRGELVTVADGYAQNVLLPKKLAVPGTAENLKKHQESVKEAQGRADQSAAAARDLLKQIDGKSVTISVKASDTGTLFKSLHEADIVVAIKKDLSVVVPDSALELDHPIKKTGTYEVPVKLLGAKATVSVVIVLA